MLALANPTNGNPVTPMSVGPSITPAVCRTSRADNPTAGTAAPRAASASPRDPATARADSTIHTAPAISSAAW